MQPARRNFSWRTDVWLRLQPTRLLLSAAYFYDAEGRDREISFEEAEHLGDLGEHQLVWFDVERHDEAVLERLFPFLGLTQETARKISRGRPLASIASFEKYFHFCITAARGAKPRIDFIVANDWLLTVRDDKIGYFESYRERDRGESLIGHLSPLALAGSLVDWHFEDYQEAANAIQSQLDKLDSEILGRRRTRPPLSSLALLRTEVARLRARLDGHRGLVHSLLRPEFSRVAEEKQKEFFTILESHFNGTVDSLARAREGVVSSFDLYATRTAQDTNELVRILTLVTVATGLGAAVAGILGMNFDVPIFHTGWIGFVSAVTLILLAAMMVFLIARLRRWL